ncbi:MAG TPA: hypothetical protein VFG83_14805 [Kofleriaceae bacterium]|nr:hypothetical protein [Kofleriaceae bacterium]
MTRLYAGVCRAIIAAIVLLTVPPVAAAQPTSAGDDVAARAHFSAAEGRYKAGDYAAAAREYLAAYAAKPMPVLLLNAAQAFRLLGDKRAALANYQKFVALAPDHEFADDARHYIASLEAALASEARPEEPPPARPENQPPPATEPTAGPAHARVEAGAPLVIEPAARDRTLEIAGVITAGGGALFFATAAAFAVRGARFNDQVEKYNADPTHALMPTNCSVTGHDPQGLCADGRRANLLAWLSLGAGTACVITGAVLYVIGTGDDGGDSPGAFAVAPRISPSGFGLAASGRF